MATIKLYGYPISNATHRVMVGLYEKSLNFEFVNVDMKVGAHKQQPFISLNPFGQVPAFEDGDLQLFESRAISNYVAERYAEQGTPLVPTETKQKATIYTWMEAEAHQFEPCAGKVAWELYYKRILGLTVKPAVLEENEAKLSMVLDIYEKRLSESKYLGGDEFSLADMNHIPTIQCLLETEAKKAFESRPHVNAWVADITSRPAWAKVLAIRP